MKGTDKNSLQPITKQASISEWQTIKFEDIIFEFTKHYKIHPPKIYFSDIIR